MRKRAERLYGSSTVTRFTSDPADKWLIVEGLAKPRTSERRTPFVALGSPETKKRTPTP
jgi:hypothetical protein